MLLYHLSGGVDSFTENKNVISEITVILDLNWTSLLLWDTPKTPILIIKWKKVYKKIHLSSFSSHEQRGISLNPTLKKWFSIDSTERKMNVGVSLDDWKCTFSHQIPAEVETTD